MFLMYLHILKISAKIVHLFIFYHLSRSESKGQQSKQRSPELPLPVYLLQLIQRVLRDPKSTKRCNLSSMSIVCPTTSSCYDMTRTSHQGGTQKWSYSEALTISTCSFWCGGVVAVLWVPPDWSNSSPYLGKLICLSLWSHLDTIQSAWP